MNEPPDHCPHCGQPLSVVDPPTVYRCADCDRAVFFNPTPVARVAVVDGDELLLCAVGTDDVWEPPGGRVEGAEDPPETAARELRVETGLTVDPDALRLFDVRSYEAPPGQFTTRLSYAVSRAAVEGRIDVGEEHVAARFWSSTAFAAAAAQTSRRQPAETRPFSWWLDGARRVLG